jgi:hypothetical protein
MQSQREQEILFRLFDLENAKRGGGWPNFPEEWKWENAKDYLYLLVHTSEGEHKEKKKKNNENSNYWDKPSNSHTWFCAGWVVQILATEFGKYT